jgi:hypothetical protein
MARLGKSPTRTVGRDDQPLAAVDAALTMASQSRLVTVDEALRLLHGVEATVGNRDARVAGIVADASETFADQVMLDRDRLVDTLLDIRLVISD